MIEDVVFFSLTASSDGTVTDNTNSQNLSYDVSKLVDFPGFNVAAPHKMKDVSVAVCLFKCLTSSTAWYPVKSKYVMYCFKTINIKC